METRLNCFRVLPEAENNALGVSRHGVDAAEEARKDKNDDDGTEENFRSILRIGEIGYVNDVGLSGHATPCSVVAVRPLQEDDFGRVL